MPPFVSKRSLIRRSSQAGFSLVEIVMALGIMSFAMLPILGLVPIGLDSFRAAMNFSVESAIAQQLASDVQRTDFSSVGSGTSGSYYFDDQGIKVEAVNKAKAMFTAEVDAPVALAAEGIISGIPSGRTVLIKITNHRIAPSISHSYPVVIRVDS